MKKFVVLTVMLAIVFCCQVGTVSAKVLIPISL